MAERSPASRAHHQRELILDAVAQIAGTLDPGTTLDNDHIARQAGLPRDVVLGHFKDSQDALLVTLELGHDKGQAIVERALDRQPRDWTMGVRGAVGALLEFFAAEPDFTRLAFLYAPAAATVIARRNDEHLLAYANRHFDQQPQDNDPPAIAPFATVQTLAQYAHDHASNGITGHLLGLTDHLSYIALAPFLGAHNAARAITSTAGPTPATTIAAQSTT